MTKQTKVIIGIGIVFVLYMALKDKKKGSKPSTSKPQGNASDDPTRSSFSIVPLPDIKNYKFGVTTPLQTIGATSSSPIIIATPINR